ncbi:MAG TPA: RNA polymerase sigma factor [Symbiobacteriaceae bacterium]|nr:RNA polymerase sigma factor [Symbiobacteriaceae bacterium]
MPVSDELLMRRFQAGDRSAFADLVRRHRSHALHFGLRMLHDPDMAEDVAQEAFARILLHPDRWTGRSRFTSYLFAILKNLCVDELRWRSRWQGCGDAGVLETPDTAPPPDEQVVVAERDRRLHAALAGLSPDHRAALVLREFQELAYEEIAEVMGWSAAKTKVTIYRARLALGRAFTAAEGGHADGAR